MFPNNGTLNNGLLVDPYGAPSGTIKVRRGGSFESSDLYTLGFEYGIGLYSSPTPMFVQEVDTVGFRLVRTDL